MKQEPARHLYTLLHESQSLLVENQPDVEIYTGWAKTEYICRWLDNDGGAGQVVVGGVVSGS